MIPDLRSTKSLKKNIETLGWTKMGLRIPNHSNLLREACPVSHLNFSLYICIYILMTLTRAVVSQGLSIAPSIY